MIASETFIALVLAAIAMTSVRSGRARVWGYALCAFAAITLVPVADRHSLMDQTSLKEKVALQLSASMETIASLGTLHSSGEISDLEYASNLERRALTPAKTLLQDLRSRSKTASNQEWISGEISDWEFRCLGLQIVIDVFSSRSELRMAKQRLEEKTKIENESLDDFWNNRMPLMQAHREKLLEFMHKPSNVPSVALLATARGLLKGLDSDIRVLAENAARLEILRTEAWLDRLKSEVIANESRHPAAQSPPGLSIEIESRLRRLEAIRETMDSPPELLLALERHLERIQENIPRSAASFNQ